MCEPRVGNPAGRHMRATSAACTCLHAVRTFRSAFSSGCCWFGNPASGKAHGTAWPQSVCCAPGKRSAQPGAEQDKAGVGRTTAGSAATAAAAVAGHQRCGTGPLAGRGGAGRGSLRTADPLTLRAPCVCASRIPLTEVVPERTGYRSRLTGPAWQAWQPARRLTWLTNLKQNNERTKQNKKKRKCREVGDRNKTGRGENNNKKLDVKQCGYGWAASAASLG